MTFRWPDSTSPWSGRWQGELIEDWSNDLKQPGAQAIIIAAAAALVAGGCFYFARLSDEEDELH